MATLPSLTINDTGYLTLPNGTVAQRPGSPTAGMTRYNNLVGTLETYNGSSWQFLYSGYPIQNGLVLYVDPSNTLCYSGSGTTLTDMSGNGYNLTTRGTTSVSNGYIDLGSSGDTTNFLTGPAAIINGRNTWTISIWFWNYSINSSLNTLFEAGATNDCLIAINSSLQAQFENAGASGSISNFYDNISPYLGQWTNLTITTNNNNVWATYKNGALLSSPSLTSAVTVNSSWGVVFGQELDNNNADSSAFDPTQKHLGRYGTILVYNRALSATEVMRNYVLLRDKYGAS